MAQPSQHEIKQELVDAIRMLEHAEYIDHNGHCSVRRDANSFYINSGASMRAPSWNSSACAPASSTASCGKVQSSSAGSRSDSSRTWGAAAVSWTGGVDARERR